MNRLTALVALVAVAAPTQLLAADPPRPAAKHGRIEDVIYGRRDGHALTMDVFTPAGKANGAAVILCVSAEYRSSRRLLDGMIHPFATTPFLDRGYAVFAVMHSSQPRYTVVEAVEDTHRAVRFIKANGHKYGVARDRLAAAGGSSGGHLALMLGCAVRPGVAGSADPVERESSQVAAVGCFFPPTDFVALDTDHPPRDFAAAFDFREFDAGRGTFAPPSAIRRREILAAVSPVTHAGTGSEPTRIVQMRNDPVVPFAQSEALFAKLKASGVACDLVAKDGDKHFHPGVAADIPAVAEWFDRHVLGKD